MKQIYLIHYDAKDGSYFRSYATQKGAEKSAKEWMDEYSEEPNEWHRHSSDCWEHTGYGEYMTIHELDLEK